MYIVDGTPEKMRIFEDTNVEIIECDGQVLFETYSTGMALGYSKWNGRRTHCTPIKERIEKVISNADIEPFSHGGEKYLTEEQLYDFMLEARTKKGKRSHHKGYQFKYID